MKLSTGIEIEIAYYLSKSDDVQGEMEWMLSYVPEEVKDEIYQRIKTNTDD